MDLHLIKGRDYGKPGDTFANINRAQRVGVEPWLAAVVRMLDKVARIEAYCQRGELSNESIDDAFLDLANYALIALCQLREEQGR